ncbi:MAG: molybdopterin oxidoreductase family protein, partial [Gammaproteobacteria bacterium]|nr:molybdopterin oxidoreductase family protein [Gammaproteobacteria bacterium]
TKKLRHLVRDVSPQSQQLRNQGDDDQKQGSSKSDAAHGLMHMVISNAVAGDPYPIDTLMLFMANMAWNSSMNTSATMDMLRAKDKDGQYKIPFIVTCDAFNSETVAFSDLVLPDTTYLERYDTISMLDRPISEPDAACDSIRAPVVPVDRDVRSWQEVMVELAGRLQFPAFTDQEGKPKYQNYKDFIVHFERAPGIGFLAGWRGEKGDQQLRGAPNPKQWEAYEDNECFFKYELAPNQRYMRHANLDYLQLAKEAAWVGSTEQIVIELYSETLQKFRLAGQGLYAGPQPTEEHHKQRLIRYFDPLPCYYTPLEQQADEARKYPFFAITQRPMFMYHSWDSQNAWLRQIMSQNYLYMHRQTALNMGIADFAWAWVESRSGKIRVQVKHMEGVNPNTVWTWNAIGKQGGAWGLSHDANEAKQGFLLNHLINELLPEDTAEQRMTNSDPITGQAAWYDLKVKITPAEAAEEGSWPQFAPLKPLPGFASSPVQQNYASHANVNLKRTWADVLGRSSTTGKGGK